MTHYCFDILYLGKTAREANTLKGYRGRTGFPYTFTVPLVLLLKSPVSLTSSATGLKPQHPHDNQ